MNDFPYHFLKRFQKWDRTEFLFETFYQSNQSNKKAE